jgi:hypothetical protein
MWVGTLPEADARVYERLSVSSQVVPDAYAKVGATSLSSPRIWPTARHLLVVLIVVAVPSFGRGSPVHAEAAPSCPLDSAALT